MPDGDDRRQQLRRDEDRDILIDHSARLGRLERDVSRLVDHVDRELDALDLKYPTFDRIAKDYLPRIEQHARQVDSRQWLLVLIAFMQFLTTAVVAISTFSGS